MEVHLMKHVVDIVCRVRGQIGYVRHVIKEIGQHEVLYSHKEGKHGDHGKQWPGQSQGGIL